MDKVIVFGSSGMLGSSLVPALRALGYSVLTQSRDKFAELRLIPSDRAAVVAALVEHRPTVVVNLVAATNVDQCEEEPNLAWQANSAGVSAIAEGISVLRSNYASWPHLVHISTDQVYDGLGPHTEDDVQPINVYGISKYAGELLAERVGATILRTNFYGRSHSSGRYSFSDWLVKNLRERKSITVFQDVKFSAMHIDTLCDIIIRCIQQRPVGVFNVGCRDAISKACFAMALADALGLPCDNLNVGNLVDVAPKARRPLDMSLDVTRLEKVLDLQCPVMQAEIEHTAKDYLND